MHIGLRILISTIIGVLLYIITEMSLVSRLVIVNEYSLWGFSFILWLAVVFSSSYRLNWTTFILSMVVYIVRVSCKFEVTLSFVLWMMMTTAQFVFTSVVLANKDRFLCQIILKNERLVRELRRLLEVFPYSVIIELKKSNPEVPNVFTNEEFNRHIFDVKSKIEELNNVQIVFKDDDKHHESKSHNSSLLNYLKFEQNRLQIKKKWWGHKITILKQNQSTESLFNNQHKCIKNSSNERIYHMKSLEVNWQGQPSFMHVFIDNTDFIKLEEANNNIKWHKIMFASASHELRTPLNSVLNSNSLIADSIERILNKLDSSQGGVDVNAEVRREVSNMHRYAKVGKNSSLMLSLLVEDILDLSKFETGTFELTMAEFRLKDLMDEVNSLFIDQCKQKHIGFYWDVKLILLISMITFKSCSFVLMQIKLSKCWWTLLQTHLSIHFKAALVFRLSKY